MATILTLAGSVRTHSYNRRLIDTATKQLQRSHPHLQLRPAPVAIDDLAYFVADIEAAGAPDNVTAFKQAIEGSDGLLIATPEYNGNIPGVLKNALDWASRPAGHSPLDGLPVAVMSASPSSFGAQTARAALLSVLIASGAHPLPTPAVSVSRVHQLPVADDDTLTLTPDITAAINQLGHLFTQAVNSDRPTRGRGAA